MSLLLGAHARAAPVDPVQGQRKLAADPCSPAPESTGRLWEGGRATGEGLRGFCGFLKLWSPFWGGTFWHHHRPFMYLCKVQGSVRFMGAHS